MKAVPVATALLAAFALSAVARADEEYDKLLQAYEEAREAWRERVQASTKDGASQPDFSQLPPHPADRFLEKFERYAERHAGEPEAIPALVWIVTPSETCGGGGASSGPSPAVRALRRLAKDHAGQAEVRDALPDLKWVSSRDTKEPLIALYERIIQAHKDRDLKSEASFNLALTWHASWREGDRDNEKERAADVKQARDVFSMIVKSYPGTEAAEDAQGYLYEIDHLRVGKPAPDFTGTDAHGKEIKLSQYRGKVVFLDFWGFW